MIILIDAYNFIKTVSGQKFVDERIIKQWIQTFVDYAHSRHNRVILVFDAGPDFYPHSFQQGDVTVMYAGQSKTADELIKNWLEKHAQTDVLLITSDREICAYASNMQIPSIGSHDFYRIFKYVMAQEAYFEQELFQTLYKIEQPENSQIDYSELDVLMEQASRGLIKGKIHKPHDMPLCVRGGKKASKMDKQLMKKINKI